MSWWALVRRAKDLWSWYGFFAVILTALGVPPITAIVAAIFTAVPLDVAMLYVMAVLAYLVIVAVETPALLRLVQRARHSPTAEPSNEEIISESVLWRRLNGNVQGPFCPNDRALLVRRGDFSQRRSWIPYDSCSLDMAHLHCPLCATDYLGSSTPHSRPTIGDLRETAQEAFIQRDREAEEFEIVQRDLGIKGYSRPRLDSLDETERNKLFEAAPAMRDWWRGKSRDGSWPLFRLEGGRWISKQEITSLDAEDQQQLWAERPDMLNWYVGGEHF